MIMKKCYILFLLALTISCSDNYLEKKPNKSLVVPSTLSDLEALLNNTSVMNIGPGLGILGVDDFFMTDEGWQGFTDPVEQFGYTWESDIYRGQESFTEWSYPYRQIFYTNTVLDALIAIPINSGNETQWKTVKGRALFHRAISHYQLAQLFCLSYSDETIDQPGIPVRLNSDVDTPVTRATIGQTYDQIIADLTEAETLLPVVVPSRTQPTIATAKGLHGIVSLAMNNYTEAEKYATQSLDLDNSLLDYNDLNSESRLPITQYNNEISFHSVSHYYSFPYSAQAFIDTLLLDQYDENDLRKEVYFRNRDVNRYTFKGHYSGLYSLFVGVGIDELYLVLAESRVRNGNIAGALEDLNALLIKRWKAGTYIPITENNEEALLQIILSERQKELVFRPARWTDLRRLNKDIRFQRTMTRKLNGTIYSLPPNDNRYVYPIPVDEITFSGIEQNPR
jgi:hypothetical protein